MNDFYQNLNQQLEALTEGCTVLTSNLANSAALLFEELEGITWAGFYLLRENTLLLGPFCGRPACLAIPQGKGVCGTAAEEGCVLLVPDVHAFPGHIACDSRSRSEIVATFIAVLELCKARRIRLAGSDTDCTVSRTGEGQAELELSTDVY